MLSLIQFITTAIHERRGLLGIS